LGSSNKEGEMGRTFSMHGGMRKSIKIIGGKLNGQAPFGGCRRTWETGIKMDLI
jgi:hypothetical protein